MNLFLSFVRHVWWAINNNQSITLSALSLCHRYWDQASSEPDNHHTGGEHGEDCATLDSHSKTWFDVPCDHIYKRICQMDAIQLNWIPTPLKMMQTCEGWICKTWKWMGTCLGLLKIDVGTKISTVLLFCFWGFFVSSRLLKSCTLCWESLLEIKLFAERYHLLSGALIVHKDVNIIKKMWDHDIRWQFLTLQWTRVVSELHGLLGNEHECCHCVTFF